MTKVKAYERRCCPDGTPFPKGKNLWGKEWKWCTAENHYGKSRPSYGFTDKELKLGKDWGKANEFIDKAPYVYDGLTNLPKDYRAFIEANLNAKCTLKDH